MLWVCMEVTQLTISSSLTKNINGHVRYMFVHTNISRFLNLNWNWHIYVILKVIKKYKIDLMKLILGKCTYLLCRRKTLFLSFCFNWFVSLCFYYYWKITNRKSFLCKYRKIFRKYVYIKSYGKGIAKWLRWHVSKFYSRYSKKFFPSYNDLYLNDNVYICVQNVTWIIHKDI